MGLAWLRIGLLPDGLLSRFARRLGLDLGHLLDTHATAVRGFARREPIRPIERTPGPGYRDIPRSRDDAKEKTLVLGKDNLKCKQGKQQMQSHVATQK